MKKILIGGVVVVVALAAAYFIYQKKLFSMVPSDSLTNATTGPKNATYTIEGEPVTLKNGTAETAAAPDSASMITTQYFGNDVSYDFNNDGRMDTAFILTQSSGGSGTFFYEVVALNLPDGYVGSAGILLGDRIAPQSSRMTDADGKVGVIEVNYADRKPDESFAIEPSVGKTLLLKFDPATNLLGEVMADFEGEADAATMKLDQKTWQWVRTDYTDGRVFAPKHATAFSITFAADNKMSATTDCNGVFGSFTAVDSSLVFGALGSTEMYCDGSEEGVFNELLGQVSTYTFTGKGELHLGLKADTGTMIFR